MLKGDSPPPAVEEKPKEEEEKEVFHTGVHEQDLMSKGRYKMKIYIDEDTEVDLTEHFPPDEETSSDKSDIALLDMAIGFCTDENRDM